MFQMSQHRIELPSGEQRVLAPMNSFVRLNPSSTSSTSSCIALVPRESERERERERESRGREAYRRRHARSHTNVRTHAYSHANTRKVTQARVRSQNSARTEGNRRHEKAGTRGDGNTVRIFLLATTFLVRPSSGSVVSASKVWGLGTLRALSVFAVEAFLTPAPTAVGSRAAASSANASAAVLPSPDRWLNG